MAGVGRRDDDTRRKREMMSDDKRCTNASPPWPLPPTPPCDERCQWRMGRTMEDRASLERGSTAMTANSLCRAKCYALSQLQNHNHLHLVNRDDRTDLPPPGGPIAAASCTSTTDL